MSERDQLLALDDVALSELCRISFGYGSGPGGQKRNKSSTAVRVELPGTGYFATDCTERSQHRNRAIALRKLRLNIALALRTHPASELPRARCALDHPDYPLWVARLLDHLEESSDELRSVLKSPVSITGIEAPLRSPSIPVRLCICSTIRLLDLVLA